MNRFDRFCARNERFAIKNLMMYIIIGNVIVLAMYYLLPDGPLYMSKLTFSAPAIMRGEVWRLISFVFIPNVYNPFFAVFSFYLYYIIGQSLEREWGALKMNFYYLTAMILTAAVSMIANIPATATYINYSLYFAFAAFYPNFQLMLFFLIPIKMKYLAILNAAFFVYEMIVTPFPANLLPLPALATFLIFFMPSIIKRIRFKGSSGKRKHEFRAKVRQSEDDRPVNRCVVCGKTDVEFPDMQFRYCARCNGHYCYCEEHLFSHEHKA